MKNNKINDTIVFGMASFFYALVFYYALDALLNLFATALFDTPFMMATYTFPVLIIIYYAKYDDLNRFFKNKKIEIIVSALVLVAVGFVLGLFKELNGNKPIVGENVYQKYEQAEEYLDLTEIDKDLSFKYIEEENKVIKKGKDGVLRQFTAKTKDKMIDCTYTAYMLEDGYFLACKSDLSKNYYTKDSENFYQLNLSYEQLRNIPRQDLATIDSLGTKTLKYEFNGEEYVLLQSYENLRLYKAFKDEYYIKVKTWNLKDEILKEKKVREWDINPRYVKFKDETRSWILALATIDQDFNLEIEYEKQT